jgi:hypothetical protein
MSVRTGIRGIATLAAIVGTLFVLTASAGAAEKQAFTPASYSPFGSFSHPTGSESFNFEGEPAGVAVDNDPSSASFHDLYVTDVKHNVVDKFERIGSGTYAYVCQFNGWYGAGVEACSAGGGSPTEPFSEPVGVAVDAHGDVYVSSYGPSPVVPGAVDEFDAAGKGVVQVAGSEHALLAGHPQGIAVDSTGDLFVQNYEGGRHVVEFKRSSFTGAVESETSITESAATSIAVDPSSDDLYVDLGPQIAVYEPTGAGGLELAGEFGGGTLGSSLGVAFDSATHTVYAGDAGSGNVSAFLSKVVVLPDLRGTCTASAVKGTTATLSGEIDPLGTEGAQYVFEYGLAGYEDQAGGTLEGTGFRTVSQEIEGLVPGKSYVCRLSATNTEGLLYGIVNHGRGGAFETLPLLPVVDESPAVASEVTTEGAILNGVVNPGNGSTVYHFAYGLEADSYTQALPNVGIGSGVASVPVEQAIGPAALRPNTTYHFALIATNAAGTVTGADESFTTTSAGNPPETAPAVSTGPAESVFPSSAILTATVYPQGSPTTYLFEVGTTSAYGTILSGGEAGRGQSAVPVAQALGNLLPGVTYHYRVVAFNAAGIAAGPDLSFTTPSLPSGIVQPATPQLLAIPVFPAVKVPLPKTPKPKKKHVKKKRKKAKARRARPRAVVKRHR